MRGEYESAIGLLEHALKLVREREDEQTETRLTVLLANVLIDGGSLPRARELLGSSIAKAEGATDPILQARLYWSQSRLHSAEANTEAAARYARMALAAIELTENVEYAAMAHHLLAYIELERGNAAEALDLLERGHELAVRMGGASADDRFRVEKARALAALGRDEEAVALATETADGPDRGPAGAGGPRLRGRGRRARPERRRGTGHSSCTSAPSSSPGGTPSSCGRSTRRWPSCWSRTGAWTRRSSCSSAPSPRSPRRASTR